MLILFVIVVYCWESFCNCLQVWLIIRGSKIKNFIKYCLKGEGISALTLHWTMLLVIQCNVSWFKVSYEALDGLVVQKHLVDESVVFRQNVTFLLFSAFIQHKIPNIGGSRIFSNMQLISVLFHPDSWEKQCYWPKKKKKDLVATSDEKLKVTKHKVKRNSCCTSVTNKTQGRKIQWDEKFNSKPVNNQPLYSNM